MTNKIDKSLYKVHTENTNDISVIIYSSDIYKLRECLSKDYSNIMTFDFISALGVKIKNNDINKISKLNIVNYITSVSSVKYNIHIAKNIIHYDNIKYISQKYKNKTIAIIDTGVYPHIDFVLGKNRILKFVDLISNKSTPYDDNGHGTFVAGLVGAKDISNVGYFDGVERDANFVIIKALDSKGETDSLKILEAMQYVIDSKDELNIGVVCMSFGSVPLGENDPLVIGSEILWNNGIVVVAAAGNSGPNESTIKAPGVTSKIITVGALDDDRNNDFYNFQVATFSSRGPAFNRYKPDLIVSGVDVISTARFSEDNSFYTRMSGTSVSTPIVAGVVLKLLKHNNYSPDQIKYMLTNSTTPIVFDRNSEGWGVLNLDKLNLL